MTLNNGRGKEVRLTGWRHSNVWIFTTMLIAGLLSLWSSFELSKDAVILAANPNTVLNCDLSSVVSCGAVGVSWQAALLGFPNAFLGLISMPVVITIAVAALSGIVFKRWFMVGAQIAYLIGVAFAFWLFYQSAFVIGALCPFCLVVLVGTVIIFFTLLQYNIRENNLYLPPKAQEKAEFLVRVGVDAAVAIMILVAITTIIFAKYGMKVFGG